MIRKDSPAYKRLFARDLHCVWHGRDCDQETLIPQHRAGKGMGGDKSRAKKSNRLSNLILLCSGYNGLIEHDSVLAEEARELGIKISRNADPRKMPVQHAQLGVVLLDDEGGYEPAEGGENNPLVQS